VRVRCVWSSLLLHCAMESARLLAVGRRLELSGLQWTTRLGAVSGGLAHAMTDLRLQVSRQVRLLRDSRTVPNVSDPSTRSQGRRYLVLKTPRRPMRLSWDGNRIILHAQHVGPDTRVLPKYRRAGVRPAMCPVQSSSAEKSGSDTFGLWS
jgi:hypothetical protein